TRAIEGRARPADSPAPRSPGAPAAIAGRAAGRARGRPDSRTGTPAGKPGRRRRPNIREGFMVTHVDADVQQLWNDYHADPSDEHRNALVEHYLPLVKYNADRIWQRLPDGVDVDDLISAGVFGLMDAIAAFDMEKGVKFETYGVSRIRGAMLDELRTMD